MKLAPVIVTLSSLVLFSGLALGAQTPGTLSLDTPWACSGGSPVSISDRTEGIASMQMRSAGYSACQSQAFSCDEITTSDEILIDVKLPTTLPNPYWVGDVSLYVEVPSAGLYNDWVGMSILTGLPKGQWVTISIAPTGAMLTALAGNCGDARIKFALNTSAQNVLIDNIRFKSTAFSMTMPIEANEDDGQFDPSLTTLQYGWSTVGERNNILYSGSYNPSDWGGLGNGLTTAAFRFALAEQIPAGATVVDAWISLFGRGTWSWSNESHALAIGLEFSDDAAPIAGISDLPFTLTGRPLVSAVARWPELGGLTWLVNNWNDSVNVAPLIQELVDTYGGLSAGAHVQFFVYGANPGTNGEVAIEDSSNPAGNTPTLTVVVE
jgi:hypothetical protein